MRELEREKEHLEQGLEEIVEKGMDKVVDKGEKEEAMRKLDKQKDE